MKNKIIFFTIFCWLVFTKLLAQPFTTNRTGTAPNGTNLILADIINSTEQINAGDQMSYRGTQSIHLTAGFSASGLTGTGLFHAYLQPMQIAYVLNNAGAETEMPYTTATAYTTVVPQYSRFEIGVQLPADVQTQIDYFLNPNLTQAPNSSYCQTCTPQGINPYDQSKIQIEVDFTNGTNTHTRYGFYYQDFSENTVAKLNYNQPSNNPMLSSPWTPLATNYPFRVRFAPPTVGTWYFNVILKLNGNAVASFTGASFTATSSSNPGFLTLDNTLNKMKFSDGTLFFGIGEDIGYADEQVYNFVPADPYAYQKVRNTVTDLYQKNGNFVRMRFDPWSNPVETNEMQVYNNDPATVKLPANCINNYHHNQRHMWEFDQTLGLCEQHSVYIMLNLLEDQYFGPANLYGSTYFWPHNPYKALTGQDDGADQTGVSSSIDNGVYKFFTDAQAQSNYQNTLFYINARWGYSTNIALWEHINETNNLGNYDTHTQDPNSGQEIYGQYYNNDNGDPSLNAFVTGVQAWTCIMKNYMDNFYPDHTQTTGYGTFRSTDVSGLACLDVFSGNNYSGSFTNNPDKYANHLNPATGNRIGYVVTGTQMYTKPFILGETGELCAGANYSGVDQDAPDNNSDIEFHKNLWSSVFSGSITTALWWPNWYQNVSSAAPASMHRALNLPALNTFLTNVNFNQPLYPQNEYPTEIKGLTYGGSSTDFRGDTLRKSVDNFFLLNATTSATQGYGYCVNRSYWWLTDPAIYTYDTIYKCSSGDVFHVDPNGAFGINGVAPPNNTDPPVHFYYMQPNTVFDLTLFETAGATQVGTAAATSDANGNLDFYLPFGAGANIDATHPPDYAYVLGLPCTGCQRTAKTNQTKGINNSSSITNNNINVYPNPASNLVYLNFNAQSAGVLLVNINDVNGNQIIRGRFATNVGANNFKMDLSNQNPGVYFIHVTDENGVPVKNDKLVLMGQ